MPDRTAHAAEVIRFVRARVNPDEYDDVKNATPEQLAIKVAIHLLEVLAELDCTWDSVTLEQLREEIRTQVVDELASTVNVDVRPELNATSSDPCPASIPRQSRQHGPDQL